MKKLRLGFLSRPPKPSRPARRTLQTLRGTGKVYARNQLLCAVRYSVTVHQGIVYAGFQPGAGVTSMDGTLFIIDGVRDWKKGTRLTLEMEDGRMAVCVTTTGDVAAGSYGIRVDELSRRR